MTSTAKAHFCRSSAAYFYIKLIFDRKTLLLVVERWLLLGLLSHAGGVKTSKKGDSPNSHTPVQIGLYHPACGGEGGGEATHVADSANTLHPDAHCRKGFSSRIEERPAIEGS